MKRMKKFFAALLAAAVSVTSLSTGVYASADDGTLVIARAYDAVGLDPGFLTENAQIVDNIFDRLVMRDEDLNLVPGLATEWSQLDDLTWQFKLREGVKFHNGEDFTAEDVKYSIDRVLDPEANAPTASYISSVDHVDIVDDYTVNVVTKTPDPLIPTRFNRYPTEIVPKDYVEEVGEEAFSENPVGTGPYKFVSWAKDEKIVLEANEDYWNGAPEIKTVEWRSIPEASSRVSALVTGEVDMALGVQPEQLETIEQSDIADVSVVERGGNTVYIGLKTDQAPFDNKLVRQALNYAIDVDSIVEYVLGGAAVATNSLIGPKDTGYAGEPEGYEYDPEKAKELLAEAGYPDGFETTLDSVNWYMHCDDVAQAVAGMLEEVGIKVTVNSVESSVYRTSVPNGEQSAMYFLGWSSTNTLDADAAIYAVLHSGESYSTYSNEEVDSLLDEARSCTDEEKRNELYAQIQDKVIEDAPRIFLYQENKYIGINKNVSFTGRQDDSIPVTFISFNK